MGTIELLTLEAEELYEKAIQIVKSDRRVSATILQRRLGVSFALGARIMDLLELRGVIGPQIGARPREILLEAPHETTSSENL